MAAVNGTVFLALVSGAAIGASRSATLTINNNTGDATSKASNGWEESILTSRNWEITFDGLYDPDGTFNFEGLYDLIAARTATSVVEFAEIDGTGGGDLYRGVGLITSLSVTAPYEDVMTYSGTIKGTGALSKATVASS